MLKFQSFIYTSHSEKSDMSDQSVKEWKFNSFRVNKPLKECSFTFFRVKMNWGLKHK